MAVKLGQASAAGSGPLDAENAQGFFENAVRLGPNRAIDWALLGEARERTGDESGAQQAFERGLNLFPKSPQINWLYANLLIRRGGPKRALPLLHDALEGDPSLCTGAFDLAWRAGLRPDQTLSAVPRETSALEAYLDFLVRTGRLDAARDAWNELMAMPGRIDFGAPFRYFDALLYDHSVEGMQNVWSDLQAHAPGLVPALPADANLVVNGGFERPLLNGGFDWRTPSIAGANASIDTSIVHSGARSLRLDFDGTRNIDFSHVVQYVPVKPDASYRLAAWARGRDLTTDSGPRFTIYDAYDSRAFHTETEDFTGSFDWRRVAVQFTTGRTTRLVVLQLKRPPSRKIENQISGTLWIDDVSVSREP